MVVFGFCFIGSAKAAERAGLPGGYTLEQSHALCESKLKTGGYQECMANKRGLFSVTQDGTPYENFVWSMEHHTKILYGLHMLLHHHIRWILVWSSILIIRTMLCGGSVASSKYKQKASLEAFFFLCKTAPFLLTSVYKRWYTFNRELFPFFCFLHFKGVLS